jgi:hypothetical protein
MPKRSTSLHVPKDMQARFEEITHLTDAFCHTYLNEEYRQLCRELTATLCRKRPSPLERGKATVWACGINHAASHGQLSLRFLADPSHCRQPDLGVFRAEFFDHAGQIEADPRSVGHVSHGSRLVNPLDGGPESLDLDALGQWADHRCALCPTGDPGGRLPPRLNPLHSPDVRSGHLAERLKECGRKRANSGRNLRMNRSCSR